VAIFLASTELLRTRARRRAFVAALTASAIVQIGVGVAVAEPGERIHGPFVNPDHFAGYLEIVLALAFAGLWTEVLRGADRERGAQERAERIERRLPPLAFRVLVWGFLAAGITLTRSRGGIAAALAATAVMLAIALSTRRRRTAGASVAIVVAVLIGIVFVAGAARRDAVARFLSSDPRDIGADMRVGIWRTSIAAWRPFRWLGSGLGSFREAFRLAQPRGMSGLVEQAHSDSLQMLVTGGIVGLALSAAAFGAVFLLLARELKSRRHREERALALAGIGALLSLVLHGAVDFNLSVPAIPATLAAVLGLAFAAADEPSALRLKERPPGRPTLVGR
jgi:O-antigen ligase